MKVDDPELELALEMSRNESGIKMATLSIISSIMMNPVSELISSISRAIHRRDI